MHMYAMKKDGARTGRLLALLWGLGSLDFFGTAELQKGSQRRTT